MKLSLDTALGLGPSGSMQGWEWLALESERRTGKRLGHGADGAREWVDAFMSDGLSLFGLHMDLSVAFLMNLAEADPQAQDVLDSIIQQVADQSGQAHMYAPDPSLAASTMLGTAARGCSDRAATYLLAQLEMAGIDFDRPSPSGDFPLHAACAAARSDLALALLASGADPNVLDGKGNTPLHRLASTKWNTSTAESLQVILGGLLRAGAKMGALDAAGVPATSLLGRVGFPADFLAPARDTSANHARGPGSRRAQ